MATPSMGIKRLKLTRADLESAVRKLNDFIAALPPGEQIAINGLLQRPDVHGRATHVIAGQADGILVTIGPKGVHVGGPIGPGSDPLVFAGEGGGEL